MYQIKNIQYVANGPLLEWAMGLKTEPTNYQKSIKFVWFFFGVGWGGGVGGLKKPIITHKPDMMEVEHV